MGAGEFIQAGNQIRESWATGIEWELTHLEYAERGIANYGRANYHPFPAPEAPNDFAYQYWNISDWDDNYTTLFINLIDNFNEQGVNFGSIGNPYLGVVNDNVSGYTIAGLENDVIRFLLHRNDLADRLKAYKPAGVTDVQIDQLLNFY